jgi:hypothetical protein
VKFANAATRIQRRLPVRSWRSPTAWRPSKTGAISSRRSTSHFSTRNAGVQPNTGGTRSGGNRGWLELHESGTYVRFSHAGAALFT